MDETTLEELRQRIRRSVEKTAQEAFLDVAEIAVAMPDETDEEFKERVKTKLAAKLETLHPHGGDVCAPPDDTNDESPADLSIDVAENR